MQVGPWALFFRLNITRSLHCNICDRINCLGCDSCEVGKCQIHVTSQVAMMAWKAPMACPLYSSSGVVTFLTDLSMNLSYLFLWPLLFNNLGRCKPDLVYQRFLSSDNLLNATALHSSHSQARATGYLLFKATQSFIS
eukprot:TRINITY_DN6389_c0_g1_i2.p1 TRINITY_DN6389_c0_g1~~TRINITY_DN6389_c0_g1_i2.p1  ORF type:complete len:138 (-),score=5.84 TRINITY_DN6389_c0_g1_i2:37-450(-)